MKQAQYVPLSLEQEVVVLYAVDSGLMSDIALDRAGDFEEQLLRYVSSSHPDIMQSIAETKDITDETNEKLTKAIKDFKVGF